MKRFMSFLVVILFFSAVGFSQTTLNETFEGSAFPPGDWTTIHVNGDREWELSTDEHHGGAQCAFLFWNSNENYLITPKLSVATGDSLVFYVKGYYGGTGTTLTIEVSTTDNSSASSFSTTLSTITSFSDESWERHVVYLNNYAGQNIYVAFHGVCVDGDNIYLDDVTGPEVFVPTCPKPTAVAASNPTLDGLTLSWTSTNTNFTIQYMPVDSTNWANSDSILGASNPYIFNNLSSGTKYKFRVKSVCSATDQSEWSLPIIARTTCDMITTMPYSETFDAYAENNYP